MNADTVHQQEFDRTGYWGRRAVGCLFVCATARSVLFARRSAAVAQPSTWSCWGGAIDPDETAVSALRREIREETGYGGEYVLNPLTVWRAPDADFEYFSFVAHVDEEFVPTLCDENDGFKWARWGTWPTPLHPNMGHVVRALYGTP